MSDTETAQTECGVPWQPTSGLDVARERAALMTQLREFFSAREVLEVDTPIALRYPNADPHIESLSTELTLGEGRIPVYLRTSPEHAMKRLLAAGFGAIYQIGKVFRDGEAGRLHNPEFTLVEWYRPGWNHRRLMQEVGDLVKMLIPGIDVREMTLKAAYQRWAKVDPWETGLRELRAAVATRGGPPYLAFNDCLDFLLSAAVQTGMQKEFPGSAMFLHGYPPSQAALARMLPGPEPVAARFELFVDGTELANGYWELTDPVEQRARFEEERQRRHDSGERDVTPDEHLLAALGAGMPECAGVALGLERLHMVVQRHPSIENVICFPSLRA